MRPLSFLIYLLYFIKLTTPETLPVGPMCIWRFDSESALELNPEVVILTPGTPCMKFQPARSLE